MLASLFHGINNVVLMLLLLIMPNACVICFMVLIMYIDIIIDVLSDAYVKCQCLCFMVLIMCINIIMLVFLVMFMPSASIIISWY